VERFAPPVHVARGRGAAVIISEWVAPPVHVARGRGAAVIMYMVERCALASSDKRAPPVRAARGRGAVTSRVSVACISNVACREFGRFATVPLFNNVAGRELPVGSFGGCCELGDPWGIVVRKSSS